MPRTDVDFRTLSYATDVDVLPETSIVEDRGEYVVVRTPSNPTFHWGNFLMFRRPPVRGDRERWEAAYEREFAGQPRSYRHVALGWDVPGERGEVEDEFLEAGYDDDAIVTLVAEPHELTPHPRANVGVVVRALDLDDEHDWERLLELHVATRPADVHAADAYREFAAARMADRRARFAAGDGAWYVAELDGEIVAGCGIVVTHGRARYQSVETLEAHRRKGIARRVVAEAGRLALNTFDIEHLVIVAEADYHALPLYRSLGFVERERCYAVCWWPTAPNAARHPVFGSEARDVED